MSNHDEKSDTRIRKSTNHQSERSNITQGRLENGIRYACIQTGCSSSIIFGVFVAVGARHETDQTHGVAHLIEHLLFRGTPTYPTKQALLKPIYKYGGEINAMTCHEYTLFHVKMPASKIHIATDVYLDMFSSARIGKKDVQVETKTVIQEKRQTQSSPSTLFMHKVHTTLFQGTPLGHNVSGNVAHLSALTLPCIYAFMDTFYVPDNVCLVAAGHVDCQSFVKTMNSTWGKWKQQPFGILLKDKADQQSYAQWRNTWDKTRKSSSIVQWPIDRRSHVTLLSHSNTTSQDAMISIAFPVQGKYSRDETLTDLVGTYLAGNMISPLFQKLREEKGWVYSVSYMDMMFYDAGVAQFVCRTKADPSVIVSIVRTVLQHIQEIGQRGMDDEKFKEVQEYVTMRIESDKDDVFSWLTMAGEQMMHSDTIDELYPSWIQRVQRVTKQDVNQAASTLFDPKLLYLTIWIPSSYEQTVSTHLSDYLHVDATIQRL